MRPILKSTKVSAKKPAAAKAKTSNSPSAGKGLPRKARKPASLPKSDGDAGVQAYIASMEPWQAAIAKRVDALVVKHVPGVRKAVRWHCPFYGVEGQGWFLAFAAFQHHVKFSFFKGTRSSPFRPSANSRTCARWTCASRTRSTRSSWRPGSSRRPPSPAGTADPRAIRRIPALGQVAHPSHSERRARVRANSFAESSAVE